MIEDNNNMSLQSTYTILKPMKKLVGEYEIKKMKYRKEEESIPSTVSVSKFGENQGWRSAIEKQY